MNTLRNIFRPSCPRQKPPPQAANTTTAYVMDYRRLTPYMRKRARLTFAGISLSLPAQVTEATRVAHAIIRMSATLDDWESDPDLETPLINRATIYAVPTNQLLQPRDLQRVYATQKVRELRTAAWGPVGSDLTTEILARRKRNEYRATNRDTPDPFKALIGVTEPQHLSLIDLQHPNLYIVFTPWSSRPKFGIFTTYDEALAAAPAHASIVEVRSTGGIASNDAKQVRGHFDSGWGYATGYAPTNTPT